MVGPTLATALPAALGGDGYFFAAAAGLDSGGGGAPAASSFELHGTHVEVRGPFKLLMPGPGVRVHGGRAILTVPALSHDNCILLLPGSCLSHPLCAMPGPEPAPPALEARLRGRRAAAA